MVEVLQEGVGEENLGEAPKAYAEVSRLPR